MNCNRFDIDRYHCFVKYRIACLRVTLRSDIAREHVLGHS